MSDRAIRSIMVAGDGLVGLSAALAFSRAFPRIKVTILAVPPDPAALTDRLPWTLPAVGRFHAAIGFDELDLVRRGLACHHLGTRFEQGATSWMHSFGEVGRPEGAIPFHQLWLRAFREGRARPFEAYSAASVIGAAGKFVHPSTDPASPLSTYLYGLRLNPDRYRAALVEACAPLARIAGEIMAIEQNADGALAAVLLDDERRVEADLFVDCTGPSARLLSVLDPSFVSWSDWIPSSHVELSWGAASLPTPVDLVRREGEQWHLSANVPGATLNATVLLGERSAIHPGRRPAPFTKNVLAIGDSSVIPGPLLGLGLSLAHSAILRAIDLFPGRDTNPLELAEYNRLTAQEQDRARDLLALFHIGETTRELPASLARTLTQWSARGRLSFFEEESVTADSWAQTLLGCNILPDAVTPLAQVVDSNAAATAMNELADGLTSLAAQLPDYADYLARMGAPA